jgi:TonB family protein
MPVEVRDRSVSQASRRRVPRFRVQAELDVTVLRAGVPDTVPGRSLNLCERGMAAMLAAEVAAGESVTVEVRLPSQPEFLRARAVVKYQDELRCGLEFVGLSTEQRAAIRGWAKESQAEAEISVRPAARIQPKLGIGDLRKFPAGTKVKKWGRRPQGNAWKILLGLIAVLLGIFWWQWNRGWHELESGLSRQESDGPQTPQARVLPEEMQKLLIHRVEPIYPAKARRAKVEGVIALDLIVGRDGSVLSVRPLNGPAVLAQAAMDALRWWKFAPYRVNGKAAVVETTMAVEFKP